MKTAWHGMLIAGYAVFALVVAVILPAIFPAVTTSAAVMSAILIFMGCALVHEVVTRRQNEAQTVRRMLTLKKAYDRQKQELESALAEIRARSGTAPPPPAAPSSLEDILAEEPAPTTPLKREMPPLSQAMVNDPEPPTPSRRFQRPPSPDEDKETLFPEQLGQDSDDVQDLPGSKELREMEAEVKVLHSLVEQLYNDDGLYGLKSESKKAKEGADKGKGDGKQKRKGLRIVGQKDEEPVLDIVREGLRHDRIDLYLQPIVSLPQRKRRFYECFSRIRAADGAVIKPEEYLPVAEKEGLVTAIDNMLLFRSVQLLRKVRSHDYSMSFFCNVSPNSLGDQAFLKDFIGYMESHQDLAASLVMELNQKDVPEELDQLSPHMDRLGKMGYRFALDGVEDFDLDFKKLQRHHFHFVKVNAKALIDRFKESPTGGEIRSFKQQLDDKGIDMIVEHIETEQMLIELLDFNIDYGQGFLFGEPRISKDPTTGLRAL